MLPKALENTIEALGNLPGVGPRTAERYATYLFRVDPKIYAIEQTKQYHGTYHVLGGAISPIDGITPDKLHIEELISRVKNDAAEEIIIATNPSVEGESTALLLQRLLSGKYPELKITRLARGLPLGVDLSFADQITLGAALTNRTKL